MAELEQEQQKSAEDRTLEITLKTVRREKFESTHTSTMEMCVTPSRKRCVKIFEAIKNEVAQTCDKIVSSHVETRESGGLPTSIISSSSHSKNIGSCEDSDNRLIPVMQTPLSTNKKYMRCKRSIKKDFGMYDPQHDMFSDCPELNKANGLLNWNAIKPENCESSCTSVSKAGRSPKNNGDADNFVTPKRSSSGTKKKYCNRNLKVEEVVEGNTRNNHKTKALTIYMQGQRVLQGLWRRTQSAKRRRHDSPIDCGSISPQVDVISPLPKTPMRFRIQSKYAILSTQPATPILDSYEKECNNKEFYPTHPSLVLLLKDVVAYVEVRSGGDNRSIGVKDQLMKLGATIKETFSNKVTHVIFKEGLPSTYIKALKRGVPVVSVLWIEACKKAGFRVSERMFPVEQNFRKSILSPKIKLRKTKSIQPDYDGKIEGRKKRVIKALKKTNEGNISDELENSEKLKSPKLMSIAEDESCSVSHTLLKQGVLVSGVSTDSDCSPDNFQVIKKKGTKRKSVPLVPKWAKNSFSGNPVVETIVGVGKIRKKDVTEMYSECPAPIESPTLTLTPCRIPDSPLAIRLLQKISSPGYEKQTPSTSSVPYDNRTAKTASEICVTPVRTKKRKIIEDRGEIRKNICKKICKKDVKETSSECPALTETPTITSTRTHNYGLRLSVRLLQKASSSATKNQAPSTSSFDPNDNKKTKIASKTCVKSFDPTKMASKTCVTPVRTRRGKAINEKRRHIRKWTRKSFSKKSDTLGSH